jgi:N-methylhydantoinase A
MTGAGRPGGGETGAGTGAGGPGGTGAGGPGWRIGADIGGTFTDIVALGPGHELRRMKASSTVDDYGRGICDGLAAGLSPAELRAAGEIVHGTTIATNAILEEAPARLALITTEGFRDLLDLRRSRRPTLYDLTWQPPPSLVPRRLRLGVAERIAADGTVITPLDEDSVREAAAVLRSDGVAAVAVCLLNAYANPEHERRIALILATELPSARVTLSSSIAPEPGEYERTSTTVVNGFLLPVVEDYLARLERSLHALGVSAPLQVMQSDGTTAGSELVRERPFLIIESGPAAGVSAAARLAAEMGRDAIITFDMGGTTAKASLVEQHRVELAPELEVGDSLNRGGGFMRGSGYLVRAACVDLTEVGSGGGSIAWLDKGGGLRVGPMSAGSTPGPACYGQGGREPTVTDAHVVLGYVNPVAIAGGTKPLQASLATEAIGRLADTLGLSVLDTAFGIFQVATATMRRAVRAVSVERGRDPRRHTLIAFGGAGGLHAAALAAEMEMEEVVIPVAAGLFSSLGLLFAETAVSRVEAVRVRLSEGAGETVSGAARRLAAAAVGELTARHPWADDGASEPDVEVRASLRYVGQSSTLRLPYEIDSGIEQVVAAFHSEHRRVYGHAAEDEAVELTALRARASWPAPAVSFAELARQELAAAAGAGAAAGGVGAAAGEVGAAAGGVAASGADANAGRRTLYFGPGRGLFDAPIITRAALAAGTQAGPAVIEEAEATILVPPGATASLDPSGSVILRVGGGVVRAA